MKQRESNRQCIESSKDIFPDVIVQEIIKYVGPNVGCNNIDKLDLHKIGADNLSKHRAPIWSAIFGHPEASGGRLGHDFGFILTSFLGSSGERQEF